MSRIGLEEDAEIIVDFIKVSPEHKVYILCSLNIWRAFDQNFIPHFADSDYELREGGKVIMNKKHFGNFIRFVRDLREVRARTLDKNVLCVVTNSFCGSSLIGRQRALEILEREIKPRGCQTIFGDY